MSTAPTTQTSIDEVPFGRFHAKITAMTFGANFSDGYALGIIGALLPVLGTQWELSGVELGLLGASALIGLFFGSVILGRVSDKIGRQKVYVLNFLLIAVASVLQLWAPEFWSLFVLRLLIGFGLGADYAVGPTLLSEFAPRKHRGMMLASLTVLWTVGYVTANVLGAFLVGDGDAWRWLLASGAIPALIVLLVRIGAPESPAWLISKGRVDEAKAIVKKYLGIDITPEQFPAETAETVQATDFKELFGPKMRKRTWFGVALSSCRTSRSTRSCRRSSQASRSKTKTSNTSSSTCSSSPAALPDCGWCRSSPAGRRPSGHSSCSPSRSSPSVCSPGRASSCS